MNDKRVLIFGATGRVGGATARELLLRGWQVRAVTRNPEGEEARVLAVLGAEVARGDMEDRESLDRLFKGMTRVLSLQNWSTSGVEGEILQGKLVADAANAAGIQHLVYISAGNGDPDTGVPHFNSKLVVEDYMRALKLPFTIVRPAPFMELLTEKDFYPSLGAWGAKVKILGWDAPIPWVAVRDIGVAAANIFENPETWIGKDVSLFGDIKTMRECRDIFMEVDGKKPFRLSLPLGLFKKMAGEELVIMWHWLDRFLRTENLGTLKKIAKESGLINPAMTDMKRWLQMNRSAAKS